MSIQLADLPMPDASLTDVKLALMKTHDVLLKLYPMAVERGKLTKEWAEENLALVKRAQELIDAADDGKDIRRGYPIRGALR